MKKKKQKKLNKIDITSLKFEIIDFKDIAILYNYMKEKDNFISLHEDNFENIIKLNYEILIDSYTKYFKLYLCIIVDDKLYFRKISNKLICKIIGNDSLSNVDLSNWKIDLFIPSKIVSLLGITDSPYAIDFYDFEKHKKYNLTKEELLNNIYSSSRVNYDENVCYIDFFKYINESYISEYIIHHNGECEVFNFNVFDINEENIDSILDLINEYFFNMIIAQQKLIYYSSMYKFSIENENSHNGLLDIIHKLYRNARRNFKNKYIKKIDFYEIENDTKILHQLYKESKNCDGKINKNKLKYMKRKLETASLKNHFLLLEEMNLLDTNPYSYYEDIDKNIALMKLGKVQKTVLKRFIMLLFEQYKKDKNDEISFSKNTQKYSVIFMKNTDILESKNYQLIKKELDLYWLLTVKDITL
mgnify:CR=1 FL=1